MNSIAKRIVDIVMSAGLLVVVSPLMLLIALAIYLNAGPSVLFRQTRAGYMGKPFTLTKFRTMNYALDAQDLLLPDAARVTPLGRLLRQLSLDELPQLWNVLRGDMSLVGPRPLLIKYMDRYTNEQLRRHDVKPGITGWAQIHGRNAVAWPERFALDLWYVDHWSLPLDLWIILQTPWQIVMQRGIAQQGHATMPEFLGSERYKQ